MTIAPHVAVGNAVLPYDLLMAQQGILRGLNPLLERPHLDSTLIEDVALTPGIENWVEHGLGRAVRGYWVTRQDAAALIWQPSASTADLGLYLPLGTSAACAVDLVVF